jgi:hypothetical protein
LQRSQNGKPDNRMTCQPYIGAANEHALDPGHRYLEELEMDGLHREAKTKWADNTARSPAV